MPLASKTIKFYSLALLVHKALICFYLFPQKNDNKSVNYNPFNNYYSLVGLEDTIAHPLGNC